MARETFDEVLQRRDGYTQEEVDETKQEILDRIADGEDGFDIIDEYGLEPDYLEDLIAGRKKRIVRRLALSEVHSDFRRKLFCVRTTPERR